MKRFIIKRNEETHSTENAVCNRYVAVKITVYVVIVPGCSCVIAMLGQPIDYV